MKRHTTRSLALLAGATFALAACSAPGGAISDRATGSTPSDASDGGGVITVSAVSDMSILEALAEQFAEAYPGWTAQITQIPGDQYATKLRLSVQADDSPDIAYMESLGDMQLFEPLNDTVYAAHDFGIDDFNRATLEFSCGHDGSIYCVGGYNGAMALFYNKELFDAAGVEVPATDEAMTFADYAALSARVTSETESGDPVWGGDAKIPTSYVDPGNLLSDDGRTAELTDPDYVETWEILVAMIEDGVAPSPADLSSSSAADLFAQGRMATFIGDSFAINTLDENGIDWGVAPVPVQPGQDPWVNVWTNGYGIPKGSENAEMAGNFLAMLADEGQELEAARNRVPLRLDKADELFASVSEGHAQYVEVSNLARPGTFTPSFYSWLDPIRDAWNDVAAGKTSVADALASAEPKAQQGLDTSWRVWEQALADAE